MTATAQNTFEVRLPIGYTDGSGHIHRQAFIRKMRGYDEDLLYDRALSAGQLVTQLLANCMVRLGDLKSVDSDIVAQLYTADRNLLLVEIRRLTLGDLMQAHYRCPQCGATVAVVEDLGIMEVRSLGDGEQPEEIALMLDDGFVDKEGTLHKELTLRLPRGADEEFVSPMAERNQIGAQDALVLRCVRKFGTLPASVLQAYGVKILRELTLGDRQRIQEALSEHAPGIGLKRWMQCGSCGGHFQGVVDMTRFFVAG